MKAQDYLEINDDLQEVTWDIEDMIDTYNFFTDDRLKALEEINTQCSKFMTMFETYKSRERAREQANKTK